MTHINLLPWRERRRLYNNKQFILLLCFSLGFVALSAAAIWGYLYQSKQNLIQANQYIIDKNEGLEATLAKDLQQAQRRKQIWDQLQQLQGLAHHRTSLVQLWSDMAESMPSNVYLTRITREQGLIIVSGKANESSQVSQLVQHLQQNKFLQQVQIRFINNNTSFSNTYFDFEIGAMMAAIVLNQADFDQPPSTQASGTQTSDNQVPSTQAFDTQAFDTQVFDTQAFSNKLGQ